MILVDTSVWIASLRHDFPRERRELDSLLDLDQVATTEVIFGEVLQGARTEAQFDELADKLDVLHFYPADRDVWLQAAALSFNLRRQGLTTALSDLVIATIALQNDLELYTVDSDFQRVPGLRLHEAEA